MVVECPWGGVEAGLSVTVFAYGTLEIEAVMEAVTGRAFPRTTGQLNGFARVLFRGQPVPGLVPDLDESTPGALYGAVDARSLALLDRFEGDLYERRSVHVRCSTGGHVSAHAYLVAPESRALLSSAPWNRERFVAEELPAYLEECARFHRRHGRGGRTR